MELTPRRLRPQDPDLPAILALIRRAFAPMEGRIDPPSSMLRMTLETLRAEAESLEAEAPDTVRFTRAIKDAVAYEDRVAVIEALWQVVLADGTRAEEEDALLRLVASLLGVSDPDSARARQRVENAG